MNNDNKTPEEMAEEYAELMSFDVRGHQRGFLAGYKAAENHFRDATEKVEPQWISVKDRLPEEGVWVLGYYLIYENNIYDVGVVKRFVHTWAEANIWLTNHKNGPLTYEEVDSITHWQPLPAPPKEEK
jgi:hypothetical protein